MRNLFFTGLMLFISTTISCQDWQPRPDSAYYLPAETRATYCSHTSLTYSDRYKIIENYIPLSSHPAKTIKINFNIIQRNDGTGNFSNTQNDINTLINIFTTFRNRYITLSGPSDPIAGIISLSFTKFDFELSNIYFYQNTTYFNSNSIWSLNNYVKGLYPERMNELNIYFTGSTGSTNATMPGEFYSSYDLGIAMCKDWENFPPEGIWSVGGGLCHEMGHCLNLTHPYPGGGTACTLVGMVAEEGWFADLFGEPFPGNAFHLTSNYNICVPCGDCPPITIANTVNPYVNEDDYSDRVTNNFMGNQYNFRQYLSPSQIGKAHRAAYFSALRRYIKDDCYNANSPIIVSEDETWDFNIRVYQDIIIENSSECTFTCHVELPYNAKIIVRDGSKLIVDGSISGVNEEAWKGQIEVEPGGELIINDDGEILLGEGGFILIDKSETYIATLTYNEGANVILEHTTSLLEIIGNLNIGVNAQFTFTGDGYIKFSKPGPDSAPDNIFAGTNASFVLEGTGKNDKKMEIQQSSVHFPALAELRFENCKIEMGASARMQTSSTSSITFENIKITSTTGVYNAHRSFHFYGQPNVTINNCIFENGYHGLYGNLTYGGSPLYISNSTFQNNARGIYIYNKGLNLNNCTVKNNTDYVF